MATEEFYEEEEFIINLTIDGTEFEEVEVKVTDPNKTIRDQITSIVSVFELPKIDNGGNPIQYLLGQIMEEGEEPRRHRCHPVAQLERQPCRVRSQDRSEVLCRGWIQ